MMSHGLTVVPLFFTHVSMRRLGTGLRKWSYRSLVADPPLRLLKNAADPGTNNAFMPSVTVGPVEYTTLRRGFSSTARFAKLNTGPCHVPGSE